ncbi:MAG: peptidoglycan-binding protein [Nitrosomonas sp.]|nr:peptidoglycan-binding protein [Nitrosomonas sp.]
MRFDNNKMTTTIILLLTTITLFACKPIIEPKHKQNKDAATEPAKTEVPATATAPAPAPAPAAKIEDVEKVQVLESTKETLNAIGDDAEMMVEDAKESVASAAQSVANNLSDGNDVVISSPEIMRKVQQALIDRGFNPGPVDGRGGSRTAAALNKFQKQNGIPVGKLTKKTLRELGVDF